MRRQSAYSAGFKIDTVVISGVNDDELVDLIEYGKRVGAEVRFIEYMDVGGATKWSPARVSHDRRCSTRLARATGASTPIVEQSSAPADRFRLPDGTDVRHHLVDDGAVLRAAATAAG